jgi:hypothetical protein
MESNVDLLMSKLSEFYTDSRNIAILKDTVKGSQAVVSLRMLDWFVTCYCKVNRTWIIAKDTGLQTDIYQEYKRQLRSYSKRQFDPFCRKNKIDFYYAGGDEYIETSSGQLCFFRWVIQSGLYDYIKFNAVRIDSEMKQWDPTTTESSASSRSLTRCGPKKISF